MALRFIDEAGAILLASSKVGEEVIAMAPATIGATTGTDPSITTAREAIVHWRLRGLGVGAVARIEAPTDRREAPPDDRLRAAMRELCPGLRFAPSGLRCYDESNAAHRDERHIVMLTIPPLQMPNIDLDGVMRMLTETGKRTHQLWLTADSMAFIARGREYRSEFHINPSYEIQYSLRGDLKLHYRTDEGVEKVAVVREGSCLFQPPLVPHSPRFAPDAFQLIIERARLPGEIDRFHWYCASCDDFLHEETYAVDDYRADPVTRAYRNFYDSEEFRTCRKCGTIAPAPASL